LQAFIPFAIAGRTAAFSSLNTSHLAEETPKHLALRAARNFETKARKLREIQAH
jgi:phage terminase small subunit